MKIAYNTVFFLFQISICVKRGGARSLLKSSDSNTVIMYMSVLNILVFNYVYCILYNPDTLIMLYSRSYHYIIYTNKYYYICVHILQMYICVFLAFRIYILFLITLTGKCIFSFIIDKLLQIDYNKEEIFLTKKIMCTADGRRGNMPLMM